MRTTRRAAHPPFYWRLMSLSRLVREKRCAVENQDIGGTPFTERVVQALNCDKTASAPETPR